MSNGHKQPGVENGFDTTIHAIVGYLEEEIEQATRTAAHLERDSRSRRTWAATIRAYEKILNWILNHKR